MRPLLLCFGLGALVTLVGGAGCAASHEVKADVYHDQAKRDLKHAHPIKAIEDQGKSSDERRKAEEDR